MRSYKTLVYAFKTQSIYGYIADLTLFLDCFDFSVTYLWI